MKTLSKINGLLAKSYELTRNMKKPFKVLSGCLEGANTMQNCKLAILGKLVFVIMSCQDASSPKVFKDHLPDFWVISLQTS